MNFSSSMVDNFKRVITVCKQVGIEVVVLAENRVMGANGARNLAIISDSGLNLADDVKVGIGRLSELEKRLGMFSEKIDISCKLNDKSEVALMSLSSGKMKAQFRCTSMTMLDRKYPKTNEDPPENVLTLHKSEVAAITRAIKTYGSANVIVKVNRNGSAQLECSDSSNDQFTIDIEKGVEQNEAGQAVLLTYNAANFCQVLDLAAKDEDEIPLVIGGYGSMTAQVKGFSIVMVPNMNEE